MSFSEKQDISMDRRISVAPMMDWTDRHCRFFLRQFAPHTWLYTEMITAAALIHGKRERLLAFDPIEHPVALQVGGSEPDALAQAAAFGEERGYDEININVGCPSERVQSGAFGACLMREPELVADCVAAMRTRVKIPVTVKTRIGIEAGEGGASRALEYDDLDYELLHHFVRTVAAAGCDTFMIHARKAVLKGFSPKDNREIPPLRYDIVRRLKGEFPSLRIHANGGVRTLEEASALLEDLDGVMIGREAYHNPYLLAQIQQQLHPDEHWQPPTRLEVIERLIPYADARLREGHSLHAITRHVL
ncbi:MAG: tRNA dihydrouridine(20/20a) synthase DusA, partial [Gammaproteobacteria bacterium]|nr:tRNA dihydrouridine(20/20a) synthase DusA [Gammaproteobacteria bacterium]